MYQPQRLADAATSPALAASACTGPRRALPRRSDILLARALPASLSVAMLAGAGALVLNDVTGEPEAETTTTALVRDESVSRGGVRAFSAEAPRRAVDEVTPAPAVASWQSALGSVVGTQYAQSATPVRAAAAAEAAEQGSLTAGQQVEITQNVVNGFRQIVLEGKLGYVSADALADTKPEPVTPLKQDEGNEGGYAGSGQLFWPTAGSISSPWGMRMHPILKYKRLHGGVDIGGRTGAPIYAAADGVVTKAANGYNSGSGNNVRINHGKGLETGYLHMHKIHVKVGQKVKRGQIIGTVGNTGLSTAPHLHFSVYVNGVNTNPAKYIKR